MKLTKRENNLLAGFAVFVALCIALPWAGETYSSQYLARQEQAVTRLQAEVTSFEERIAGIDEQRRLIQTNRQDYLNWVGRGVVGRQDPVEWIKAMQAIQQRRRLFVADFGFEGESARLSPPSASPLTADSSVNLAFWRMNLAMPMLHDLDIFMFLGDLRANTGSFFFPTNCALERVTGRFELNKRVNLRGNCVLEWVSVNDPSKREGLEEELNNLNNEEANS
jgi:hypothetical protein